MNAELPQVCVNHPRRETGVRCSKCGKPICPACMIQTPVGMRCRPCAGLRKLPQYQVGPLLLGRSAVAGLVTSVLVWIMIGVVPYLRFFLAILVGFAVGEVMSRAARRRGNHVLEAMAVVDIIIGAVAAQAAYGRLDVLSQVVTAQPSVALSLLLPVLIAGFVAIVKLR